MCEVASFKNFENSLKTVKVMTKNKVALFYLGHGVYIGVFVDDYYMWYLCLQANTDFVFVCSEHWNVLDLLSQNFQHWCVLRQGWRRQVLGSQGQSSRSLCVQHAGKCTFGLVNSIDAFWDENECFSVWGQKVKGQGHSMTKGHRTGRGIQSLTLCNVHQVLISC